MTQEMYIRITQPFRDKPEMAKGIHIANKICTGLMYVSYPVLLAYLFFIEKSGWLSALLVPGISFVLLSLVRAKINRPRPYEKFGIAPVIPKDTKGNSFPSRHVFSASIIAMTFLLASPWMWLGCVYLVVAGCLGVVRVLSGVHYPSDVVAGMLVGILAGVIGYIIF